MTATTFPGVLCLGLAAIGLALGSPAAAQTETAPSTKTALAPPVAQTPDQEGPKDHGEAAPPKGPPLFRVAGWFEVGYTVFTATETFKATLGEANAAVLGGGAGLTHRSGIFVQVDATKFKGDGERAFVHNDEVFTLGIPLRVETLPIEFTVGYKFFANPKRKAPTAPRQPSPEPTQPPSEEEGPPPPSEADQVEEVPIAAPMGGMKPYVGGGVGLVRYKETSDFAGANDDVDERYTSYHVVGGIEVPVWKAIGTAFEVNYRWVKDAFGTAGLSKEFGEDDLGGFSLRVKITVGR